MMIVGYDYPSRGQRYVIFADLVGGHDLNGLDPSSVPDQHLLSGEICFHVVALLSYWRDEGNDDVLSFPKGAKIRKCENVNGDWLWGVYCGKKGIFPGNHVEKIERVHQFSQKTDGLVTSKALVAT